MRAGQTAVAVAFLAVIACSGATGLVGGGGHDPDAGPASDATAGTTTCAPAVACGPSKYEECTTVARPLSTSPPNVWNRA
jgi:hypothetical protein